MTEPTPEPEQPIPEPTELESIARLAAEAAVQAMQRQIPEDLVPRLELVEQGLAEIREMLAAAAGPQGGSARLGARLEAAERQLEEIRATPARLDPEQLQLLDGLRHKVAHIERTQR